jgi:predicted nucleotidyltransferase
MTFDTSVLDAALVQHHARHERERRALLAKVLRLLDELGPGYGLQKAYVFGSLARFGRFTPNWDVDIAVIQSNPRRFCEFSGQLSMRLGREIDLDRTGQVSLC